MMRSAYLVVALVAGLALPALGQDDALAARLGRLPVSVGANVPGTWPRGTSWTAIGIREHLGYEHFRRANGASFRAGRALVIPGRHLAEARVADGLVVNLPELMLYRWSGGKPVAWYPISIGMITSRWHTPVGELKIASKAKNPTWNQPDWAGGGRVPPGPRNPLGDRWIGLSRSGYGIHGTSTPSSIGRTVSHGCMRMFPAHVRELFEGVTVGMPVVLTYETVQAGYGEGMVFLAVYPDVYHRGTNSRGAVQARLAALGATGVLTDAQIDAAAKSADGVATPVLGSRVPVTLNGAPLALPLGPTFRDGRSYLPVRALAAALGAVMTYDPVMKTVTLTRAGRTVTFNQTTTGFTAIDAYFCPVRQVLEGLGGTVTFDGAVMALGV